MTDDRLGEFLANVESPLHGPPPRIVFFTGTSPRKDAFVASFLKDTPIRPVNVGRDLSAHLLSSDFRSMPLEAADWLARLFPDEPICIGRIQILFDPGMDLDVIPLFRRMSANRLLCIDWPGGFSLTGQTLFLGSDADDGREFKVESGMAVLDEADGRLF